MGTVIQVQHSSDFNRDGIWHDLEVIPAGQVFSESFPRARYINARLSVFRGEYGRPVRAIGISPFAPGEHGRADPLSSAPVTFDDRAFHKDASA